MDNGKNGNFVVRWNLARYLFYGLGFVTNWFVFPVFLGFRRTSSLSGIFKVKNDNDGDGSSGAVAVAVAVMMVMVIMVMMIMVLRHGDEYVEDGDEENDGDNN